MLRVAHILVAGLVILGVVCRLEGKTAPPPGSTAREVVGGKYLLVLLTETAADPKACPKCARLRATYPVSGVYRNDGSTTPLWTTGWYGDGSDNVVAVAEREGEIHVVVQRPARKFADLAVVFFQGHKAVRAYEVADLVDAALKESIEKGVVDWYEHVEIDGESQRVHVETAEGSRFVFDVFSGDLVFEWRRRQPPARRVTAEEQRLGRRAKEAVDAISRAFMSGSPPEDLTDYTGDLLIADCEVTTVSAFLEAYRRDLAEMSEGDSEEELEEFERAKMNYAFRLRPLGVPLPRLETLRHGHSNTSDLYVIPREEVVEFICPDDGDEALAEVIPDGPIYATTAIFVAGTREFVSGADSEVRPWFDDRMTCALPTYGEDGEGCAMLLRTIWAWDRDWKMLGYRFGL